MLHLLLSRRPGRDEEKKNEERTGAKKKGNFGGQNKKHIYSYFCGKLKVNCRCKKILVTNQNIFYLYFSKVFLK